MKRFVFPLRSLAVLREHRESRAREEFATAIHACGRAEKQLGTVRAGVAQLERAMAAGRRRQFHAAEEMQSLAAYGRECAVEARAEQAVTAARDEQEKRRAGYLTAYRELEGVQRLEAHARRRHRQAMDRAEQAEYDDFASRRSRHLNPFRP